VAVALIGTAVVVTSIVPVAPDVGAGVAAVMVGVVPGAVGVSVASTVAEMLYALPSPIVGAGAASPVSCRTGAASADRLSPPLKANSPTRLTPTTMARHEPKTRCACGYLFIFLSS
jgi:hypothetical protein